MKKSVLSTPYFARKSLSLKALSTVVESTIICLEMSFTTLSLLRMVPERARVWGVCQPRRSIRAT